MLRIRTVKQAYDEIKRLDPDTAITLNAFKIMVKTGVFPVTEVGNRTLVNLDEVISIMESGVTVPSQNKIVKYGELRKVSER